MKKAKFRCHPNKKLPYELIELVGAENIPYINHHTEYVIPPTRNILVGWFASRTVVDCIIAEKEFEVKIVQ